MNRELLEKTFSPEQIKQREGNFGKVLDYVEAPSIIKRLNDAFESEWSFQIIKHEILKDSDEVIVLGELKAGDVVKTQFGSSRITKAKDTGNILSLADDLKAAATDALKKASTLLGVGLHLYNGDKPSRQNNGGRPKGNDDFRNGNDGNGNGGGRLSGKQYNYILSLATKDRAMSRSELDALSLEMFGVAAQYLSKTDASALIGHLLAQ